MQPQQPEQKEKQHDSNDPAELRRAQAFYYFLRIRGCQTICSHCVYGLFHTYRAIQPISSLNAFRKRYSKLQGVWSDSLEENEYCPPCLKPLIQAFEEEKRNGNDQYSGLHKLRNSLRRDMTRILFYDGEDKWKLYLDFSAKLASIERYLQYYTRACESSCDIIARLRHEAYSYLGVSEAGMSIASEPCEEWRNYLLFQATLLIGIMNIPIGRHEKRLSPDDDFRTTQDHTWESPPRERMFIPIPPSKNCNVISILNDNNWAVLSNEVPLLKKKTLYDHLTLLNDRRKIYKYGIDSFPEKKLLPEPLNGWNRLAMPKDGSMAKWFLETKNHEPPFRDLPQLYTLLPLKKNERLEQQDALNQLEGLAKIHLQTLRKRKDFHQAFLNCRPQKLLLFSRHAANGEMTGVNGEASNGHYVCQVISACAYVWNQRQEGDSFICLGDSFLEYRDNIRNEKFSDFLENQLKRMLEPQKSCPCEWLTIAVVFSENQRKKLRHNVQKRLENLEGNKKIFFEIQEVSEDGLVRVTKYNCTSESREEILEGEETLPDGQHRTISVPTDPEPLAGKDLPDREQWLFLRNYMPLEEWKRPKDSPTWNKLPKYERQNILKWIYDNACWMLQGLFIGPPQKPLKDNVIFKMLYENSADKFEEAKKRWAQEMPRAFDADEILLKMKTYPLYSREWGKELPDVLRGPQDRQKLEENAVKERKKGRPFMKVWYQTGAEMTDMSASMLNAARFITLAFGIIEFLKSGKLNMTAKDFLKISRGYYDQMRAIKPLRESHRGNGKTKKKTRGAAQGKKRNRTPKYKDMNDFLWKTIAMAKI